MSHNLNVFQTGMSLKLEWLSKWNINQTRTPPKLKHHSNKITLNLEFHANWNVTQIAMSLKLEHHSN